MKESFLLVLLLVFPIASSNANDSYLMQADKAYQAGDKKLAKSLYLKAAKEGSAEAHFAIAYKYNVSPEESIFHFSEAAKKGHEEAVGHALDDLLFRANSLNRADPQKALEVYKQAKKANPSLKLYDEEAKLKTIQMCIEPGKFDAKAFCKKYNIPADNDETIYYVWKIAEEASRGGRFRKPNSKLILDLVCRGGWAPAEHEIAVLEAYKNWKKGEVKEFNICDNITSGGGMSFCASRIDDEDNKDRESKLKSLGDKFGVKSKQLLKDAYKSAVKFIELKAHNEEGHGGSGRGAWITGSEMKQKNEYLKLVEKIHGGFKPLPKKIFIKADQRLNTTYKKVIVRLKKRSNSDYYLPSVDDARAVQRLWIPYR